MTFVAPFHLRPCPEDVTESDGREEGCRTAHYRRHGTFERAPRFSHVSQLFPPGLVYVSFRNVTATELFHLLDIHNIPF